MMSENFAFIFPAATNRTNSSIASEKILDLSTKVSKTGEFEKLGCVINNYISSAGPGITYFVSCCYFATSRVFFIIKIH